MWCGSHPYREDGGRHCGELSGMDREGYQKRIDDLLNAVSSLLDANNAMGEKIQKLEKIADELISEINLDYDEHLAVDYAQKLLGPNWKAKFEAFDKMMNK